MLIIEDVQISANPVVTGSTFVISLTVREELATWGDVNKVSWAQINTETWARIRDKMFEGGF